MPGAAQGFLGSNIQDFLLTPEGMELASVFPKIRRAGLRRKVLELVRAMAELEAEERRGALSLLTS